MLTHTHLYVSYAAVSAKALYFLLNSRSSALIRFLSVSFSGVIFVLFACLVAVLPAIQACFHAFICSGYKPLTRQYSLNSTTDSVAVSNTTENVSSVDHLSDELTFDTFKPEV